MLKRMFVTNLLLFLVIVGVLALIGYYFLNESEYFEGRRSGGFATKIGSFEECMAAGFPIMESYPRQCVTEDGEVFREVLDGTSVGMSLDEAQAIAKKSECGDRLKEVTTYNPNTETWWIDLDIEKEGCNPACVVHTDSGEAEINWRCTGLIAE